MVDKYSENLILSTKRGKAEIDYWTNKLSGETTLSSFPKLNKIMDSENREYVDELYIIPEDVFTRLNVVCNKSMYGIYMYLLASVKTLLYRYCGSVDQIVAMPVFKQKNNGVYLENVLPIRTRIEDKDNFKSFLIRVKDSVLEADNNQNLPIRKIAELMGLTIKNEKLKINTVVALENIHRCECIKHIKYDSMFTFLINNNQLQLKISYNRLEYHKDFIYQIYNHLINLLNLILENPSLNITTMEVVSKNEKNHILNDFNNTNVSYPRDKTIHQLFEEQVLKTPNNIAIVYKDEKLTYSDLNKRANVLAKQLRLNGVSKDSIVCIMMERSVEMIIAMIAVLKSGGAYLPIDPKYPNERIQYIIEDSQTKILLTHKNFSYQVDNKIKVIDFCCNELIKNDCENISNNNITSDLAYIIYTSGSTGRPKGVMVEHKGIANLKEFFKYELKVSSNDKIIQFASFSFDAATWEVFMAILLGATLYIVSEEVIGDTERFQQYLNENYISIVTLPPIYLANLDKNKIKTLRKIITAGSATNNNIVKQWGKHISYVNAYGPTETTICSTTFTVDRNNLNSNLIPIGKPIYNTKAYILDDNKLIVPIGVKGELHIGGDILARGYLNNLTLTFEKFIENPYSSCERIYSTGDLARWLPDGNIEFLGRKDNQVKIRGYRIELEEIKNNLMSHKDIIDSEIIVIDEDSFDKYLCAYVVLKNDISIEELKEYLLKFLPEYMIPNVFVKLEKMPMNINGKVDKKSLPYPSKEGRKSTKIIEPRNKIEVILTSIWEEVLDINPIGIEESFFELGGDSIKAIQVLSRLNKHGLKLELKDLFQYKNIGYISKFVKKSNVKTIDQSEVFGDVNLTAIQKWFFERNFTDMHHWNQSVMLYRKDGFDADVVKSVFNKIVEHHDGLRMVYRQEKNKVIQYNRKIEDGDLIDLIIYDYTGLREYEKDMYEKSNKLHSSMNLNEGPLVKLALFKTSEGDHLLISIHHLVVDGVSWRIILEDFSIGYMQKFNDNGIKFQDKTVSFKEWSLKINEYLNNKSMEKEREYWVKVENNFSGNILTDKNYKKESKIKDNSSVEFKLSKKITSKLLTKANLAYNTELNDLLITSLAMSIKSWLNQDKVIINIEGHGRENILDLDISRTVGWFTSQYPVAIDLTHKDSISVIIKSVKEQLRRIPNKGINYGIIRYLSDKKDEGYELSVNPEIGFNYLGEFNNNINKDIFEISKFKTGNVLSLESENIFKININSIIVNGKMVISIIYNKNYYKNESVKKLKQLFIENINNIVKHCEEKEKPELTPSDVGAMEMDIEEFEKIHNKWKDNIKYIYNLSATQEGMLYHTIINKFNYNYFQQITFNIDGEIDLKILEKSFNLIIERHDALRTNFIFKNIKKPVQIVLKRLNNKIMLEDISSESNIKQNEIISSFQTKDIQNGFDLSNDRLIRLSVFKISDKSYKLIWSFHHIIMDGWCLGIINKELFQIYNILRNDGKLNLLSAPEYKEYIKWLEKQLEDEAKAYWSEYLDGYENKAFIPKTALKNKQGTFRREEVNFTIDKNYTNKLVDVAKNNNTTLNVVLEAIWGIIVQKYNNSNDIIFGNVISGRKSEIDNIEEMVGLFINTIPVRIKCTNETSFKELIQIIQNSSISSEKFSYYPLVQIQELSKLKNQLFESIMVFENYPLEKASFSGTDENGIGFTINFDKAFQQTNYGFNITLFPGEDIGIKITFDSNEYDKAFVANIKSHIYAVIEEITKNIDVKTSNLSIVKNKEKSDIIVGFNQTDEKYIENFTIKDLFEKQVEKTPKNKAIIYNENYLTYDELNSKANQLANFLISKGIGKDVIVAIVNEPSLEMIIGILGILKAGGAYLPIDSQVPMERINKIIMNSKVRHVLVNENIKINENSDIEIINICDEKLNNYSSLNPEIVSDKNSLAYVIYTSGTTGTPKGVLIENSSVMNYINWFKEKYNPNSEDKTVLVSSFAFDLGYTVLFTSILNGSELHLLSKEIYGEPNKLINYLVNSKITYMKLTPSLFSVLINCKNIEKMGRLLKLRLILMGGENINIDDVEKFYKLHREVKIVNHYGPTEATIGCITHEIDLDHMEEFKRRPVIGKPIDNTKIYIVDKELNFVPVGVVGEICISGLCLARGYLNDNEIGEGATRCNMKNIA